MNPLRALRYLLTFVLLGCATSIESNTPTDKSDSEVSQLIQGRWFLEEYSPSRSPTGVRAEFEFKPDHTFIYALVDYSTSSEHRNSYSGKWHISNGHLIQHWPQILNNPSKSTTSTILKITSNKMLILSHVSTYDTYNRQPNVKLWK